METILWVGGWRFFFGTAQEKEPIHLFAEKQNMECKFWIDATNYEIQPIVEYNLTPQDRRDVRKIIYDHFHYIVSEWNRLLKEKQSEK